MRFDFFEHYIENDMFPKHWTETDVLANIAYAHTNKRFTGLGNIYEGTMLDGKKAIMYIDENTGKLISAFPGN
jgi:hypothetical protein